MKTLLTIAQQNEHLNSNNDYSFTHKWSCRGYGSSRLVTQTEGQVARATGCGYDRFGTVLGDFIEHFFMAELERLAKRFVKTKSGFRRSSPEFYGLFANKDGRVYLDGGCGGSSMEKVLNAIGFELKRLADTGNKALTHTAPNLIKALKAGHLGVWVFLIWFGAVCVKALFDYI